MTISVSDDSWNDPTPGKSLVTFLSHISRAPFSIEKFESRFCGTKKLRLFLLFL